MRSFTSHCAANRKVRRVSLAAAVLIASAGAVAASDNRPTVTHHYYRSVYEHRSVSIAAPWIDDADFDHSGTLGRLGLGANPVDPEGPGNVENGGPA
jgi:hypothetical protein